MKRLPQSAHDDLRRQMDALGYVQAQISARFLELSDLLPRDLQSWAALEARAIEPNAYLSPHFILPALRHLDRESNARILLVERCGVDSREVIGACVVRRHGPQRGLPMFHLAQYLSCHSYLGLPLIDREHAQAAAEQMLRALARDSWLAGGMLWPKMSVDGPLAQTLRAAARALGLRWLESKHEQRAVLDPATCAVETLAASMGSAYKKLLRSERLLAELGETRWIAHRHEVPASACDSFLRLENTGWKAQEGTSLLARSRDEAFFREMIAGFQSAGRAFFTELRLNGEPIASTSNLVSGSEGFAFKVGWDPAYRKYSVGTLNEVHLIRAASKVCWDLLRIDSGAEPGSFIDQLWAGRRTLASVFVAFNAIGIGAWLARKRAVAWRDRGRERRSAAGSADE